MRKSKAPSVLFSRVQNKVKSEDDGSSACSPEQEKENAVQKLKIPKLVPITGGICLFVSVLPDLQLP